MRESLLRLAEKALLFAILLSPTARVTNFPLSANASRYLSARRLFLIKVVKYILPSFAVIDFN
jgi:hypothetical protein